jgi:hypothetical protein
VKTRWHFRWGWCGPKDYVLRWWLIDLRTLTRYQKFVRVFGFYFEWLNCAALLQCDRCGWIDARFVGHASARLSVDDTLAAIERASHEEVSA